ncbi:MAG: heavy metal-binding domain-containing protein [Candidatus Micrarchaeia archaeon]
MADTTDMLIMTSPLPAALKIEKIFGLVTGLTVRSRGIGGKFTASLESMGGGEITSYVTEVEKARYEAIERMKAKAAALGANAVVSVDVETSSMGQTNSMMLIAATGTAMLIKK